MNKSLLAVFAVAVFGVIAADSASAQNAILAEIYGRGVHAYNSGDNDNANQLLSMAIENGIKDPRAYYFRGMVAQASGRSHEAESDWKQGAELEASGTTNAAIGRSLSRFQGSARSKLEQIRQTARLQMLANAAARSKERYGETNGSGGSAAARPAAAAPKAAPPAAAAVTPPPAPPAAENPFADDMAEGEPTVASDDALKGALDNPFGDDPAPAAGAAPADAGSNPFGGDAGGAAPDPFGGGGDTSAPDPFGGGAGDATDNPFGGDNPFGS